MGDEYHVFANSYTLSEYYLVREHNYGLSKKYGLQAVSVNPAVIDHPRAHYRLASSYLFLGQGDSAIYYLQQAPRPANARDSIVYFELMSELEHRYWKDEEKSKNYIQQAHAIADSLTINGLNHRLLEVEWDDSDAPVFRKNKENPLSCGALIEFSYGHVLHKQFPLEGFLSGLRAICVENS